MFDILEFNKTRIAPTPSGFLHLGNVLSFSITATLAEKANASILLRIDDLDRERIQDAYVNDIFETLRFLDIPWTEGPKDPDELQTAYSQIHRLPAYKLWLAQLVSAGAVFACTCSRTQYEKNGTAGSPCRCLQLRLPFDTAGCNWRLDTSANATLVVKNIDGSETRALLPPHMHNFIVRKKDGLPSYQFTSVLDDLFYGVDCIVRGEDLWPSTLAQHYLSLKLETNFYSETRFFHHPLLISERGRKLSKSTGDTSVLFLRKEGLTASEIFSRVGQLAGLQTPVYDYLTLGNEILRASA